MNKKFFLSLRKSYDLNSNILLKIRENHLGSFESLFHLYYEPLVLHAQGYLSDRASCEDIVQEVFIYVWENSRSIKITVSLKGYLYKMVRNRMLNHLKTLKITYDLDVLNSTITRQTYEESVIVQEEKNVKINAVLLLIEKLPKKMKEIFILKHRRNFSYSEISEHLNISPNTVKTQLKRAKVILQSQVLFYFSLFFLNI